MTLLGRAAGATMPGQEWQGCGKEYIRYKASVRQQRYDPLYKVQTISQEALRQSDWPNGQRVLLSDRSHNTHHLA